MSELIHNLGIEWKVLLAQIVNFGLLLVLLKKFLYQLSLSSVCSLRGHYYLRIGVSFTMMV